MNDRKSGLATKHVEEKARTTTRLSDCGFLGGLPSTVELICASAVSYGLLISVAYCAFLFHAEEAEGIFQTIMAIGNAVPSYGPLLFVLCMGLCLLGMRFGGKCGRAAVAGCCFFALSVLLGAVMYSGNSVAVLFRSPFYALLTGVSFISLWAVFYFFTTLLIFLIRKWLRVLAPYSPGRFVAVAFFVLVAAYLPLVVAMAPGSWCHDIDYQVSQFLGIVPYSSHHPIASTLLYGALFAGGSAIGGGFAGVLCIALFQLIFRSASFAFEVWVLGKLGAPKCVQVGALIFFALNPVFAVFCQYCVKDSVFAIIFSIYVSLFVLVVKKLSTGASSRGWVAALCVAAVMVVLFRNNGLYVVAGSLPFLLFFSKKKWLLISIALALVSGPMLNGAMAWSLDAKSGSMREALSLPFNQTAKYVIDHPDDVEPWEREAIDGVLTIDSLPERYNPLVSDKVKSSYLDKGGSMLRYFCAYLSQGVRHPLSYLDAALETTYGWWSVNTFGAYEETSWLCSEEAFSERLCNAAEMERGELYVFGGVIREKAEKLVEIARNAPILRVISQMGFYAWLLVFSAVLLLSSGRKKQVIILLPCCLLLLTFVAGPLNGSLRYGLGIISVAPLVLWAALFFSSREFKTTRGS